MRIETTLNGDVSVLRLNGNLTAAEGCPDLRSKVKELIAGGNRKMVLNLNGTNYMDSTGLEAVVGSFVTASNNESQLRLAALPPRIKHLFEITRLLNVIPVDETEDLSLGKFE